MSQEPASTQAGDTQPLARRVLARIHDWFFAPAPAERLAMLRILIGTFALAWVALGLGWWPGFRLGDPQSGWKPIGLARLLDAPLAPEVALAIGIVTAVLLAAFVLGLAYRVVAPLAAIALTWTLCYRNSWGAPLHTENLLVLHVIALSIAPAADAWAIAKRKESSTGYGWAIKLLVALTAATYLLAGIAKLRIAGFAWLDGEQLRNQIAIDNLRKLLLGDSVAPLATSFLDHPRALTVLCWMTIALELGAPLALVGPRVGKLWALGAWGFHIGVILLMNIWFPYPVFGLAFVPLLRVERPGVWLQQRRQEWRARRTS